MLNAALQELSSRTHPPRKRFASLATSNIFTFCTYADLSLGIDVQAELRLKTSTPNGPGPGKPSPIATKPPSLQQAAISRSSAQRHPSGLAPKEPFSVPQSRDGGFGIPSPQFQATPPSHVSSPSHTKSPGFGFQGAMSPVGVDPQAQHTRPQMISHSRNVSQTSPPISVGQQDTTDPKSAVSAGMGSRASRLPSAYYPSPFQKHYDQLGTLNFPTTPTLWIPS